MSHHVFTMFSPHVHCNFCWFLKVLFLIWLWLKMTPKMDGQILDISKNNQFCGSVGHWYHNLEPYIAILCHTVPGPYMVIPMFPHVPWQSSTLGLPDPVAHLRRRGRSGRSGARRGPGFGRWQGHEMGRPGGIGWVPNGIGSSKPIQSTWSFSKSVEKEREDWNDCTIDAILMSRKVPKHVPQSTCQLESWMQYQRQHQLWMIQNILYLKYSQASVRMFQ